MRAAVCVGVALALAAVAVSADYTPPPFPYPAPWNPPLTRDEQKRVDQYKPRYPHFPTPRNNPCRAVCASSDSASVSHDCIQCCRTARHRVPWNCGAGTGEHGDLQPHADAHNGVPNTCCTEWTSECWDRPSADNYEHSCDMCGPSRTYQPSNSGCDSNWMTPQCWTPAGPPRDSGSESLTLTGPVYVPYNMQTAIPQNMTNGLYVQGGANVTLAPGAVLGVYQIQFTDPQAQPHLITALGTGVQLYAYYTYVQATNPFIILAPRAATLDLGDLNGGVATYRIDSTYIPGVIGTVAPPPTPAAPQIRYLSPRYRGTVKMMATSGTQSTSRIEVIGDSGLVTVAFSDPNANEVRQPFRGSVLVDGSMGAKLQLTGQAEGWYLSQNGFQSYAPFIAGALGNPLAVTLANGGAIAFGNHTQLDYVTVATSGTAPVFVEFLRNANITDGVNLSGLNAAPTGSAVVLDGVSTVASGATLGTANRFTCGGTGCYSGTMPAGGVCLPAVATCNGTACAGACSCTPSTTTLFASAYSATAMCSFATCAMPCLGGSICAGANTCTANCPATTTAHFTANCQTQDGTCATACSGGLTCGTGGVCVSPSSTGVDGSTGTNAAPARAHVSPVAAAALAVAAVLMLRN